MMHRLYFFTLLLVLTLVGRADEAAIVAQLKAGNAKEAAAAMQKHLEEEKSASAELFYNLGCTQASTEQAGAAFLSFDRALLLNPFFSEAKQNLRTLEKLGSKRFQFKNGLFDEVAGSLKLGTWKTAFWWATWSVLIALAALVTRFTRVKWPWIVVASLASVLAVGSFVLWQARLKLVDPSEISLVMEKEMEAKNAPAESAATVIDLPPGSQVRSLSTVKDWVYVEIPGDKPTRGWVPQTSLARLWPWEKHLVE